MDFIDVILPIIMFLIPIGAAVIDKNRKTQKSAETQAHPITDEELEALFGKKAEEEVEEEPEPLVQTAPVMPSPIEEGVKAIKRKTPIAPVLSEVPEEKKKKLEIDRKKLILYSEIMKPKFDE